MDGVFGVFDGIQLLIETGDDVSADEARRELQEEHVSPPFRRALYEGLEVFEVPQDYRAWWGLTQGLRVAYNLDRTVERCLARLYAAQRERWEAQHSA